MPPWLLRACVGVSAATLAGCYLHYNGMQTPTPSLHGRPAVAYAVPIPARRGISVVYIPIEPDKPPRVIPTPLQTPQPTGPPPDLPRVRPFDTVGATSALGGVDLSPCRASSAARGYGHAKVTFRGDGSVTDARVDKAQQWPSDVVACVSERLATARVREFDGPPVSVGAWLFIDFE